MPVDTRPNSDGFSDGIDQFVCAVRPTPTIGSHSMDLRKRGERVATTNHDDVVLDVLRLKPTDQVQVVAEVLHDLTQTDYPEAVTSDLLNVLERHGRRRLVTRYQTRDDE